MKLKHCADGSFWAQILLTFNAICPTNVKGFDDTSTYCLSDTMKRVPVKPWSRSFVPLTIRATGHLLVEASSRVGVGAACELE